MQKIYDLSRNTGDLFYSYPLVVMLILLAIICFIIYLVLKGFEKSFKMKKIKSQLEFALREKKIRDEDYTQLEKEFLALSEEKVKLSNLVSSLKSELSYTKLINYRKLIDILISAGLIPGKKETSRKEINKFIERL